MVAPHAHATTSERRWDVGGVTRRGMRSVRRRLADVAHRRRLRATQRDERALARALIAALPGTAVDHGPLVSIVILNRDGRDHLERCLRGLATTRYRDIEVIVVDNGSIDGSPELAETFPLPFPIRVIRNRTNRSFSDANAAGVAVATGEFVCFLNNDIDPVHDDWLGYMVETLTSRGAAAVGARLIYPRHRGGARAGQDLPDLSLQHAGVEFDRGLGVPHARVLGAGEDPLGQRAAEVAERPALTAACLVVRLDSFRGVGGFSPEYDYGIEDVDLCLKLRAAGGRLIYDGRAALWHHESATRAADEDRFAARVKANRAAFVDLWGPRIFRDSLLDAIRGGGRFSSAPFHVAIVLPLEAGEHPASEEEADRLGAALDAFGWRVSRLRGMDSKAVRDPSVDAAVVVDPDADIRRLRRKVVTIAWVTADAEGWIGHPWFDDFDLVFGSSPAIAGAVRDRSTKVARPMPPSPVGSTAEPAAAAPSATAVREALIEWVSAPRVGLRMDVADSARSGDLGGDGLVRQLQRELERGGHPTRVHPSRDWASPTAALDDIAVHVLRDEEVLTHRSQVNILLHLSHAELGTPDLYERFDQVFVNPDLFDARMAGRLSVPVVPIDPTATPVLWTRAISDAADRLVGARPSRIDGVVAAT
ncbi:MAG: glycosyltransferase family 2 protein [Chloroflexota bacterium]